MNGAARDYALDLGIHGCDMVEQSNSRGSYRVVPIVDDVVWFHFEGWVDADLWSPTEELLDRIIKSRGQVLMLGNGVDWTGYEPGYRVACTRWFLRRRASIRGVHLLVRSRILRMGVQVVNLAIPIIDGYYEPGEFMAEASRLVPLLETHLRRHSLSSPLSPAAAAIR